MRYESEIESEGWCFVSKDQLFFSTSIFRNLINQFILCSPFNEWIILFLMKFYFLYLKKLAQSNRKSTCTQRSSKRVLTEYFSYDNCFYQYDTWVHSLNNFSYSCGDATLVYWCWDNRIKLILTLIYEFISRHVCTSCHWPDRWLSCTCRLLFRLWSGLLFFLLFFK